MGEYLQGNPIELLTEEPFSVSGVPTDPTDVIWEVRDPAGDVVIYTWGVDPEVGNPAVGYYSLSLDPPVPTGQYIYRVEGTGAAEAAAEGEFTVIASSVEDPTTSDPVNRPYTVWCDGQDIAAHCPALAEGSDFSIFDAASVEASMVLFELSGSQYTGLSQPVKVRPCANRCGCWGQWMGMGYPWVGLSWTYVPWSGVWTNNRGGSCGCAPLSRVKLAGYPVREITQVKINGDVVASSEYRLDGFKYLTRMRDTANPQSPVWWPSCQILDLDDDQEGTFSVTYRHGMDPPLLGRQAAAELACQIYGAITTGECDLPQSVVSVSRQGVTIQRAPFISWGKRDGQWVTGLPLVDMFLATYNHAGLRRRPAVWSPDIQQFAKKLG